MRIHYLQHVSFEGLGSIKHFLETKGHELTSTHLYDTPTFPAMKDFNWLIIMGGSMGVYDETIYPWLKAEKNFIKESIISGKIILGICLGAQLIADGLGAKIYKNPHREIGWFDVKRASGIKNTIISQAIPERMEVFHWHGDTFELPKSAVALGESDACKNQGFIVDDRIVALQFHLETTSDSATNLIENCRDEIDGSEYVQSETEMLSDLSKFNNVNQIMISILQALETKNRSE